MRAETRHQLKQDRFSKVTIEAAEKTAHWTVEHKSKVTVVAIAVLVSVGDGLSVAVSTGVGVSVGVGVGQQAASAAPAALKPANFKNLRRDNVIVNPPD